MTEHDDLVLKTGKVLNDFLNDLSTLGKGVGLVEPKEGSQAAREEATFESPESVATVQSQSMMLIEVAGDQLSAFLKTLLPPVETIAPFVCIRALLEASAIAAWLLDPKLDVKDRVGRSIALRYKGVGEQLKWARSEGVDPAPAKHRLNEIAAQADRLGYPPVLDKRDKRTGAGRGFPSTTTLIREMLDEEPMYRLLSAVTHGHGWALQQLSFEINRMPQTNDGEAIHVMRKGRSRPEVVLYLSEGAARSLAVPVWYAGLYLGWDRTRLEQILERLFDGLHLAAARPWRSGGGAS